MDGYEVMPMAQAAKIGDIFVTCTGMRGYNNKITHRTHEGRRNNGKRGTL